MPANMIRVLVEFDDAMGAHADHLALQPLCFSSMTLPEMDKGRVGTAAIAQGDHHCQCATAVRQVQKSRVRDASDTVFVFVDAHGLTCGGPVHNIVGVVGKMYARAVACSRPKLGVAEQAPAVKGVNHDSTVARR
ncbi:hypothetical protein ASE91_11155 [Sphingomonas sp. Leaf62]|nr:hypothetical protein ASE91_11155 [Sphingomonas sp. Leaf62]